jgi:hypothetical protein
VSGPFRHRLRVHYNECDPLGDKADPSTGCKKQAARHNKRRK